MKKRKKSRKQKLTLEQVVTAAVEAGASVSISLPPIKPMPPERPRLELKTSDWPGWAGVRSIMAAMDYTDKDVMQVFKDNPSSQWIITPYEIIERAKFFAPKPAPTPEVAPSTSNPS